MDLFNQILDITKNASGSGKSENEVSNDGAKSIMDMIPLDQITKSMGIKLPVDKLPKETIFKILQKSIVEVFSSFKAGKIKGVDDVQAIVMKQATSADILKDAAGDILGGFFKK